MSRTDAERVALTGFLAGYRGLTREAYALDLRQFASWCCTRPEALFAVRRADIESFAQGFEAMGRARATVIRRLVLSWPACSSCPGWAATTARPTVFGVTLLAASHLPNWQDLAAITAFSPVIYWAVHSTLPHQRISAAVADVETEAFVELEKSLVRNGSQGRSYLWVERWYGRRRACRVSSR